MSTRAVDSVAVSMEISALTTRLGYLKGQAGERGYPLLPDARLVDCDKLVLSVFDKHRKLIAQMRSELDAIYSKLLSVGTDVETICVPKLKEVFEGQLKHLHRERGTLDHSLNAFDSLLSAHVLIEELENSAISVHDRVVLFIEGKMGIEDWESIDSSIEDHLLRLQIVFPDSKKGAEDFCQKHHESKQEILQILRACRLDLNWKKGELLEKSRKECHATLEMLLPVLEKLRKGRIPDQEIEGIQKLFSSLPLELRMLLFAARSILPDDQYENTFIFDAPNRGVSPDVWAEVRGLGYYDSERDLNKYQNSVNILLDKCKERRKAVVSEREKARQSLDKFVAKLPENEIRNPQLLLEAFGRLYSKKLCSMSPEAVKILGACMASEPEKVEVEGPSNVEQALETLPVKEATAKVVIEIVNVSTPLRPTEVSDRRNSTPAPLKPNIRPQRFSSPSPKGERPLRPSEVKNGQKVVISPPVSVAKTPLLVPVVTEVKVKCKVPEGHFLAIRGEGGDLDWKVGKKLVKVDEETYVHKMEGVAGRAKYKILLDDVQYESGADHVIEAQKSEQIVPALAMPKVVVVVNYAPKDNKLFICGTGPGMSWDPNKKMELRSVGGKFVLESNAEVGNFDFKILLSNNQWSKGGDFKAEKGKILEITPVF